jgi:hypothetical protein
MGKNKATSFNERTGGQVRENLRHQRGFAGEQNIGFWLGDKGYVIVEGPSGTPLKSVGGSGHGVTAPGFDGVAFNPTTDDLIIYDNKSLARSGNASSASAIDVEKTLKKNLEEMIERIEGRVKGGNNFPHSDKVLRKLRAASKALATGKGWPKSVQLHLYNAGGKNITGVSKALAGKGIKFIDFYAAERIRRPLAFNPAMKTLNARLRRSAIQAERKAGVKLTEKAIDALDRKIAKIAEKKGVAFARKKMPGLIGKAVLKQSAKQAAKRAASFLPVIGWGFAAQDVYKGTQDIMRGHVARGLAGMGIAVGDAAADLLHLGDAVSGIGGTALSVGVQAAAIAGQIKIEIDRYTEKMNELGEEIARNDQLPPESRLKDYYDLDDEMIAELRSEFENSHQEIKETPDFYDPPPPMDLPFDFMPEPFQPVPPPPPELPELPELPSPRPGSPHLQQPKPKSQPQPAPPPPLPIPRDFPVA